MSHAALTLALWLLALPPAPPVALSISARHAMVPSGSDGAGGFLGLSELPEDDTPNSLVPDPSAQVLAYFRQTVHDDDLELQLQSGTETATGEQRYAFIQSCHGVPILGTYALAQVTDGLLHYSRHYLIETPDIATFPRVTASEAQQAAVAHARRDAQGASAGHGTPALAIVYEAKIPHLCWVTPIHTQQPFSSWEVYVDAGDASIVGRTETAMKSALLGDVSVRVEPRCQGEKPVVRYLAGVQWATGMATGPDGSFKSARMMPHATMRLMGPSFRVEAFGGDVYTFEVPLVASPAYNHLLLEDAPLSQVDPFYFATQARAWMLGRLAADESLYAVNAVAWSQTQMPIRTDLPSGYLRFSCNAFYDGSALNFYAADPKLGCVNSGRIAKIVYHEYGHGIHDHMTWSRATFDHQVSEGAADYIAATMTNEPEITGLLGCDKVLRSRTTERTCHNAYTYCRHRKCHSHPHDEPHNAAPVLCGALWELRLALGTATADHLFMRFLSLASDMESVYEAMIAADDDEDGDPSNGTDHTCEINRAFLGDAGRDAHFPDQVHRALPCSRTSASSQMTSPSGLTEQLTKAPPPPSP